MREEVVEFAQAMEVELSKNDWKGGWKDCQVDYLFNRLLLEIAELHEAIYSSEWELTEKEGVQKECIDVANFVMMIWGNANETQGARSEVV